MIECDKVAEERVLFRANLTRALSSFYMMRALLTTRTTGNLQIKDLKIQGKKTCLIAG